MLDMSDTLTPTLLYRYYDLKFTHTAGGNLGRWIDKVMHMNFAANILTISGAVCLFYFVYNQITYNNNKNNIFLQTHIW